MSKKLLFLIILILPFSIVAKEYVFPFYNFEGGNPGKNPRGVGILIIGDYIYGTTYRDGEHDAGTIFRVKKSGKEYEVLHQFTGNTGAIHIGRPRGRLTYDGERIYGSCAYFSGNHGAAVYSIKPDGTEFEILQDFYDWTGNFINGKFSSYGGVALVDGVLYGATTTDGPGGGNLFSLNRDGSNFRIIFPFYSGSISGSNCYTGLEYYDGRLYGVAVNSGANGDGTVFTIKPDGSDYKVLHHFVKATDGADVYGALLIEEDTVFFTCTNGGSGNSGTVVSIKTDGSEFKVLHSFNSADGNEPSIYGGLTSIGDYLYGTTKSGGVYSGGVLFRIKKDGSGFEVLDHFDSSKGRYYKGSTIFDAPYLLGTAYSGGIYDRGTIWAYYIGYPNEVVTYTPEVALTTAKLWGNAYEKDHHEVLEKGFCWGLKSDPHINKGDYKVVGSGSGKFVADIYNLMPGKTYYVRAYIKNEKGTVYGKNVIFRSPHPKVSGTITMDGKPVAGVTVDFVGRETFVTGPSGTFSTEVYYGWSGTIQLSKEGYSFTPATYNGGNLKENLTLTFTCKKEE